MSALKVYAALRRTIPTENQNSLLKWLIWGVKRMTGMPIPT